MVVKYEIPMRSIYWRIVATIALCFAILQINDIYFIAAFFLHVWAGYFCIVYWMAVVAKPAMHKNIGYQ